eukprot:349816-Chlamydomonas_euryale.AAC.4
MQAGIMRAFELEREFWDVGADPSWVCLCQSQRADRAQSEMEGGVNQGAPRCRVLRHPVLPQSGQLGGEHGGNLVTAGPATCTAVCFLSSSQPQQRIVQEKLLEHRGMPAMHRGV